MTKFTQEQLDTIEKCFNEHPNEYIGEGAGSVNDVNDVKNWLIEQLTNPDRHICAICTSRTQGANQMIYKDDEHEYSYRNGLPAEILTTKRLDDLRPVVSMTNSGGVLMHSSEGFRDATNYRESQYDLILIPKYGYPLGANVWVWMKGGKTYKHHFAGTDPATGKPVAWDDGKTEWTSGGYKTVWDYCELAE